MTEAHRLFGESHDAGYVAVQKREEPGRWQFGGVWRHEKVKARAKVEMDVKGLFGYAKGLPGLGQEPGETGLLLGLSNLKRARVSLAG